MPNKIEKLYAFVAVDPDDGNEGIIGFSTSFGMMPMIGADMARVKSLVEKADDIKKLTGIDYTIKYFELADETG